MFKADSAANAELQAGRAASGQAATQGLQQKLQRLQQGQGDKQELQEACQEFEALFIQKLWEQMRDTLPEDGMLRSGEQEKYLSMFDEEFSRELAQAGGIGLSRMLMDELGQGLENNTARSAASQSGPVQWPDQEESLLPEEQEKVSEHSDKADNPETGNVEDIDPRQQVEALAQEIVRRNSSIQSPYKNQYLDAVNNLDAAKTEQNRASPETREPGQMPELKMPAKGPISSGFGWREDPFSGQKAWHSGIDIAAEKGSPIRACWPGEVAFAGEKGGYGKKIIVKHDQGWESVYAHNSQNQVQPGDRVQAGQEIARVGSSGRSTGSHLHFELRQGQQAWDPLQIKNRVLAGLPVGKKA